MSLSAQPLAGFSPPARISVTKISKRRVRSRNLQATREMKRSEDWGHAEELTSSVCDCWICGDSNPVLRVDRRFHFISRERRACGAIPASPFERFQILSSGLLVFFLLRHMFFHCFFSSPPSPSRLGCRSIHRWCASRLTFAMRSQRERQSAQHLHFRSEPFLTPRLHPPTPHRHICYRFQFFFISHPSATTQVGHSRTRTHEEK